MARVWGIPRLGTRSLDGEPQISGEEAGWYAQDRLLDSLVVHEVKITYLLLHGHKGFRGLNHCLTGYFAMEI